MLDLIATFHAVPDRKTTKFEIEHAEADAALASLQSKLDALGGVAGSHGVAIQVVGGVGVHQQGGGGVKDKGGWIPGSRGKAVAMTGHGSEYVLSNEMLAGRQGIDPAVLAAIYGDAYNHSPAAAPSMPASHSGSHRSAPLIGEMNIVAFDAKQAARETSRELAFELTRRGL